MAQFDLIIVFPIIWSFFVTLVLNYYFIIQYILPNFISLVKFRKKVLSTTKLKFLSIKNVCVY